MVKIFFICSIFILTLSITISAQNQPLKVSTIPAKEYSTKAEKDAALSKAIPEFKTQAEKDTWVKNQQVEKVDPDKISKIEAAISNEADKDAYLSKRQNIIYMTEAEFNALPARKQASVLADKNFVIIK